VPTTEPPAGGDRWIDVDLSSQTLIAYQGSTPVLHTLISAGTLQHPSPVGTFNVYLKLVSQDMYGPGYYLPDVPYVMYFYSGYAIHGAYWHNNFGQPMSHGCINLPIPEAGWLFQWSPMGIPVVLHY
jgi:lipoprotein-anchoring transpeptidase ErfK/SrfK